MARVLSRRLRASSTQASEEGVGSLGRKHNRRGGTTESRHISPQLFPLHPQPTSGATRAARETDEAGNRIVMRESSAGFGGCHDDEVTCDQEVVVPQGVALHALIAPLWQLSGVAALLSPKASVLQVTVKNAPGILAVMALAVDCKSIPGSSTQGFLAQCAMLFTMFLRRLSDVEFIPGVDVQGFVASMVGCGVYLRDIEGCCDTARPASNGTQRAGVSKAVQHDANSETLGRPYNEAEKESDREAVSTPSFDRHVVDNILTEIIPTQVDDCISNPIVLGILEGISYTKRKDPVHLSSKLVNRLHDLMDSFAASAKRKELPFKHLLCHLLEAMCCAKYFDYSRVSSWIQAILQPDYVLRGLLQREQLHARVVAAVLVILMRQHQDQCVSLVLERRKVMSERMPGSTDQLTTMTQSVLALLTQWGDAMEHVWVMLCSARSEFDDRRHQQALQANNLRVLVETLLQVELHRVTCTMVVTAEAPAGETEKSTPLSRLADPFEKVGGGDGCSEPMVRLQIARNIVRFLMLPTSIFNMIGDEFSRFRREIAERGAEVLALLVDRGTVDFVLHGGTYGTLAAVSMGPGAFLREAGQETCGTGALSGYVHNYHSQLERVVDELIRQVLQEGRAPGQRTSAVGGDDVQQSPTPHAMGNGVLWSPCSPQAAVAPPLWGEGSGRRVAAICLQSLCASDDIVRSFAATEVLDAIVRITSQIYSGSFGTDEGISASKSAAAVVQSEASRNGGVLAGNVLDAPESLEICFDIVCHILVSKHRSTLDPLPTEDISRFAQLLCDAYEISLREQVKRTGAWASRHRASNGGGNAKDYSDSQNYQSGELSAEAMVAGTLMRTVVTSYWQLVVLLHQRLQVMIHEAVAATPKDFPKYVEALQREGELLATLRRRVLQCTISCAWPGSGILYYLPPQLASAASSGRGGAGAVAEGNSVLRSAESMSHHAARAVAPLFQVICLLSHLLTMFPISHRSSLRVHSQHVASLVTEECPNSLCLHHFCFQPDNLNSTLHTDGDIAQMRTFWFMLTYYGMTGDAVRYFKGGSPSLGEGVGTGAAGMEAHDSSTYLRDIRRLAASSTPLMRMRSSDYQRAEADIDILARYLGANLSEYQRGIQGELSLGCSGYSYWNKLTFVELFLAHSLVNLESLRAMCGSVAALTQYQHFEVREFVASPSLRDVLRHITSTVSQSYLSALRDMLPEVATSVLASEAQQLVLLLGFSIASVRESAKDILTMILDVFPSFAAESPALSLLWSTLNVLDGGDGVEIEEFCVRLRFHGTPAVPSDRTSVERARQLREVVDFAEHWASVARASSPLALFETAVKFVVTEMTFSRLMQADQYAGSRLAVQAAQINEECIRPEARRGVLAAAESCTPNYAQSLMKRSNAVGQVLAASRLSEMTLTSRLVLSQLRAAVRAGLRALGVAPQSGEGGVRRFTLAARYSSLSIRVNAEEGDGDSLDDDQSVDSDHSVDEDSLAVSPLSSRERSESVTFHAAASGRTKSVRVSAAVEKPSGVQPCSADRPSRRSGSAAARAETLTSGRQRGASNVAEIDALCCAAVSLLTTRKPPGSVRLELLRYLVQGPIQLFTAQHLMTGSRAWRWLLQSDRALFAVPLLEQVVEGFAWTIARRLGLFDGYHPLQGSEVETGDATPSTEAKSRYAADYGTTSPHKILVAFLAECYVNPAGSVSFQPSVLSLLYRLACSIVAEPLQLSTKDSSFAELMRCMLLVGTIVSNLHFANDKRFRHGLPPVVEYAALGSLREKYYKCIGQWFSKTPPSWYFAKDAVPAEDELLVLHELQQLLRRDQLCLSESALGFLSETAPTSSGERTPRNGSAEGRRSFPIARGGATPARPSKLVQLTSCTAFGEEQGSRQRKADGPGSAVGLADLSFRAISSLTGLQDGGGRGPRGGGGSGATYLRLYNFMGLLQLLLRHDWVRLAVWLRPGSASTVPTLNVDADSWKAYCEAAAYFDPVILVALGLRFPTSPAVRYANRLICERPADYCHIAEAVDHYLCEETLLRGAPELFLFTNCSITQALRLLDERYMAYPQVAAYAIRSLLATHSEHLIFYLPQLLQCLASDSTGGIESFLRRMCHGSNMFTHQLLWSLQTEGEGDTELAKKCRLLSAQIRGEFSEAQEKFHKDEFTFIDLVLSLSGELKPVEKQQRKGALRAKLRDAKYHDPMQKAPTQLYLPTDPGWRLADLVPETAGAMQSAAKCPILVQFRVVPRERESLSHTPLPADPSTMVTKACIFKMGDDCRQDQISLQLIGLFQRILNAAEVPSFLYPYRVVTTGRESGIIECVPNAMSRDQIGKLVESNLAEYFVQTYGHPESVTFRRARECFIRSMASYSVASFVLNIKDRHNGNIMIDANGYLVHIDFGFIFDFSPGGDFNFESSPFKLTLEMLQLMGYPVGSGGGGTVRSASLARALVDKESYQLFVDLTIRCFLAIRQYARQICVLVELMLPSGLPCFKPVKTIQDLAHRLAMNKTEAEAADFMRKRIEESKNNMRTNLYDKYQRMAEGIEM